MKKLFFFFLALVATTSLWAQTFQVGELYYNILADKTNEVEVTSGSTKYSGSVTILSAVTYKGTTYSVTSIGELAFWNCSSLTSITIPNSVTSIGEDAFYECSSLTSITIPNSVTNIGDYAFYRCSSLTSVTIPNSVTSIGNSAFGDCTDLNSITIPNSVTSIGDWAFYGTGIYENESNWENDVLYIDNCLINAKTSISGTYAIKENTRLIAGYAFYDCSSLTSITIPNSVISIGYAAFWSCSSIASITIPNSVTSIGEYVFSGCSSLDYVTIPNSVTSIGEGAFEYCSSLTSITIPNSVTNIGDYAFYRCSSLTSVTIPNSVTSIGNSAFGDCTDLNSITIPNSVTSIGDMAFYGTGIYENESNWENDVLYIDNCLIEARTSISGAYAIKENTRLIAGYAFYDCSSLTSITIPNSVTSIGEGAFYDCRSLTSITIPNSVTSIGDYTFSFCSSLESVTIPNSVTSIGDEAFRYCTSLTSITCEAETPPTVGPYAFDNVSKSIPVYVPCGYVEAYKAASGWSDFTNIQEPLAEYSIEVDVNDATMGTAKVDKNNACGSQISASPNIGYHFVQWSDGNTDNPRTMELTQNTALTAEFAQSFSGQCGDNLYWNYDETTKTISITGSGKMYDYTASTQPWILFKEDIKEVTICNKATSIGDAAFASCSFTSITIPNSVTSIGEGAFYDCSFLTSITIGNSVTSIGSWAFYDCPKLTSVTINSDAIVNKAYSNDDNISDIFGSQVTEYIIGESVTSIGSYAFYDCSSLTSVTIPESVTSIGEGAFSSCSSLTSVTIPNSVTSIEDYTFSSCPSLASITIPNSVTSIGDVAFGGCTDLTSITIPNRVTSIGDEAFGGCSSLTSITCEAETPPTVGSFVFDGVSKSIPVYVPCGCVEAYKAANGWSDFTNIQEPLAAEYSIEVNVNDATMGTAKVDYNTSCEGAQISATPNIGYHFVQWSDGNTDNPRVLELAQNTVLTAEFAQSFSGQCGDNLYWNYDETTKTISITGSGEMYDYTASTQPWILFKEDIKEVTISNKATSIGISAFEGCISLGKLSIGPAMKNIAADAFAGCKRLYDIYCYAYPPFAEETSFANYNVYVYVPCEYQRDYTLDVVWGKFKFIECLESEETTTDGNVTVVPGINDVTITWPTEEGADTYTIVIKKDGKVVCIHTFNSEGQLISIAFAPGRDGNHPAQYAEQAGKGYRFTVTGLEEGTNYTYDVITKDKENNQLSAYSGEFTTYSNTPSDLENLDTQSPKTDCQKLLRDGQLLILRDGKTYNVMGQEL